MSKFDTLGLQKEVQLPQGVIRYRESGSGEVLLFIHGFLVNGDLWRKVVPSLSQNYRCIVPDLPLGSHEVAMPAEADLTPPALAKLISDFITALDLPAVTLVGSDTGGALCQLVVAGYPQQINRLILTNCDAFEAFPPLLVRPFVWLAWLPGSYWLAGKLSTTKLGSTALAALVAKYPVEQAARQSYFHPLGSNKLLRRDVVKILKGISNRYTKEAATAFSSFNKPVLLVWGLQDFIFSYKLAQRLNRAFPNSTLETVQDSRAFVAEDQPAALVQFIQEFVGVAVTASGHDRNVPA